VILREAGFGDVANLAGGMLRWRAEGHVVEGGSALGRKWQGRHNLRQASGAPCYTLHRGRECRDLNEEREKDGV